LDRDGVIELVSEQTAPCRKEQDQRICSNYFREDGVAQRVLHDDGERRDGVWSVDDRDRLCILWKAGIKPLCLGVYPRADDSHHLIEKEKHITTILGVEHGNTENLPATRPRPRSPGRG